MAKKKPQVIAEADDALAAVKEATESVDPALMQVWERRLNNPLQSSLPTVELKEPGYELRWINTAQQGRFHNATREQGWTPVKPSELMGLPKDLGLEDQGDGMVRRGIRGEEILLKIPSAVFKMIQRKKSEMVVATLKKTKPNLAQAAANRFGDQAADFVMGKGTDEVGGLKGDITGQIGKLDV